MEEGLSGGCVLAFFGVGIGGMEDVLSLGVVIGREIGVRRPYEDEDIGLGCRSRGPVFDAGREMPGESECIEIGVDAVVRLLHRPRDSDD